MDGEEAAGGAPRLDVRWLTVPAPVDPELRRRCLDLLSEDERGAHAQLRRGSDEYLLAHALIRRVLSEHFDVPSDTWRFGRIEQGKPFVVTPADVAPPVFSLSHTPGLVACAVAIDAAIGIDVEAIAHPLDVDAIARRFFAADELHELTTLPSAAARRRFFELWTLKEAYLKARGLGLFSVSLADVVFAPRDAGAIRVHLAPKLHDDPSGWRFTLAAPTADHVLACAFRADAPVVPRILGTTAEAMMTEVS